MGIGPGAGAFDVFSGIGPGAGALDVFSGTAAEGGGALAPVGAIIAIGAGAGALTARRSLLRACAPAHQEVLRAA